MATDFSIERPSKRPRLSLYPDADPGEDIEDARQRIDLRLKSRFEAIFNKYGRDFTGIGDVIDLVTAQIVEDNGHLSGMKKVADAGDPIRQHRKEDACLRTPQASHKKVVTSIHKERFTRPPARVLEDAEDTRCQSEDEFDFLANSLQSYDIDRLFEILEHTLKYNTPMSKTRKHPPPKSDDKSRSGRSSTIRRNTAVRKSDMAVASSPALSSEAAGKPSFKTPHTSSRSISYRTPTSTASVNRRSSASDGKQLSWSEGAGRRYKESLHKKSKTPSVNIPKSHSTTKSRDAAVSRIKRKSKSQNATPTTDFNDNSKRFSPLGTPLRISDLVDAEESPDELALETEPLSSKKRLSDKGGQKSADAMSRANTSPSKIGGQRSNASLLMKLSDKDNLSWKEISEQLVALCSRYRSMKSASTTLSHDQTHRKRSHPA